MAMAMFLPGLDTFKGEETRETMCTSSLGKGNFVPWRFEGIFICWYLGYPSRNGGFSAKRSTVPPKFNIEAENDGLEDDFPFPGGYSILIFRGVFKYTKSVTFGGVTVSVW